MKTSWYGLALWTTSRLATFTFGVLTCCSVVAQTDLASFEAGLQTVYENVSPAIVRLAYGDRDRKSHSGSGVIVTSDGYIATSGPVASVVEDELLEVHLADGRSVSGKALGWSSEFGIGILKINKQGPWPHISRRRMGAATAGQPCLAIGYTRPLNNSARQSRPSFGIGMVTMKSNSNWLKTSHRFLNYSYVVFDLDGRLIGMSNKVTVGKDALHSSSTLIENHWDELVAGLNLDQTRLRSIALEAGNPLAPRQSDPKTKTVEQPFETIREKAVSASVRISDENGKRGIASGVIVSFDGYVLTCGHHNRLPGQRLRLSLSDGRDANAVVLGTNLIADIGVLKITDEGPWPFCEPGRSATIQPSDRCVLVGYPQATLGRQPWVLETNVTKPTYLKPRKDDWYCRFWTSGHPQSLTGASGGGVFNERGQVIGVLLGGPMMTRGGIDIGEMNHARIELFYSNWESLCDSAPVEVAAADSLAGISTAFHDVAKNVPPIAVQVLDEVGLRSIGTIIGDDGHVLTKANVFSGKITCRLAGGQIVSASLRGSSPEHGFALLQINSSDLPATQKPKEERAVSGTLAAAIVPGRHPCRVPLYLTGDVPLCVSESCEN